MKSLRTVAIMVVFVLSIPSLSAAQTKSEKKGEFYFSWGYNTEWFTRSNVYINQPELQNNYSFRNIKGNDHRGWDDELLKKDITIPQYNYRLGYFFDRKKGLALEINFDHTKFIFTDNQQAHINGVLHGRAVDSSILFSNSNGFYYYLNNGANFLLFNLVKRWTVHQSKTNKAFRLDFLGKAGLGPVIPHVENSFFGDKNKPHFQLGGWNIGAEGALKAIFFDRVYLEFCNKLDYARYSNLKIYKGTARQAFATYELILNLGVNFPMGKRIPIQ